MKRFGAIFFLTVTFGTFFLYSEIFINFAVPDTNYMKKIEGKWTFSESRYLYEFTKTFSRKIDGLPYYLYKSSKYLNYYSLIYAIFKSKKTGISFFCRGNWSRRRGFQYSVSRIVFKGNDKFVVYSKDNPKEVYFIAKRVY